MKATKFSIQLALNILLLGATGIIMTFINDWIQQSGFFGDVVQVRPADHRSEEMIRDGYDWGARHYWYFWTCTLIFLAGVARVIIWIVDYWEEKPQSK